MVEEAVTLGRTRSLAGPASNLARELPIGPVQASRGAIPHVADEIREPPRVFAAIGDLLRPTKLGDPDGSDIPLHQVTPRSIIPRIVEKLPRVRSHEPRVVVDRVAQPVLWQAHRVVAD